MREIPAESTSRASMAPENFDAGIENTIRQLVDGSESQRLATLTAVKRHQTANREELGRRLRQEIAGPFSPGAERNFAAAVRDPKLMASVRSWMISTLLACDPVHPETVELLQKEISESYEPDENVRFWTLAGCYSSDAAYAGGMAKECLHDSARQVAVLASAIVNPDDQTLRAGFDKAVESQSFDATWPYLRAMRVVGLPAFTPALAQMLGNEFDGRPLSYDVLYALASPEMAKAARPVLERSPGLARTVEVMMNATVDSAPAAVETFARLLWAFDYAQAHELVSSYLNNGRYRDVPRRILRVLERSIENASGGEVPIVGYATDTVGNQTDQLGVAREVSVLTALILSKEAIPPLAIGLFGNWGSGKSFFMRSMYDTAAALASRSKATRSKRFCANIVQIKFNAWHYTDTSLWASLATYILEALNAHFSPVASISQQQGAAAEQVAKAKQAVESADAARRQVLTTLAQDEASLIELQAARQAGGVPLSSFSVADVRQVINSNPELKATVDAALDSLGLPKTVESIDELAKSLQDVRGAAGGATSMLESLFRSRTVGVFIALLLVIVFGVPALFHWFTQLAGVDLAMAKISATIAEVGLAAAALANWVKQGAGVFRKTIDKVNKAKREIELILKEKEAPPAAEEKLLAAKIALLKAEEAKITQEAAAAQKTLAESEVLVAQTSPIALLKQFLSDRLGGDDYRKHLGLVATVRDDFDKLGRLISSQNLADVDARPVERVVLYIDDLDRCPAPKVVEVLQAVHLLLAYPLFVVVVGVDSRWLIHSLTTHYRQLGGDNENTVDADWTATPQHYLEKIFQISYAIKPMDSKGYENLIGQLMQNNEARAEVPAASGAGPDSAPGTHAVADGSENSGQSGAALVVDHTESSAPPAHVPNHAAAPDNGTGDASGTAFLIEETAMTIHPLEMAFAKELHEFILSPRSAKRLINIYRILKAGLPKHELATFEGNDEVPGEFQVPMLLLAILVHDTDIAEVIFSALLSAATPDFDLRRTLDSCGLDDTRRGEMIPRIIRITSRANFAHDPELFRFWIPRVARFSFGMALLRRQN